jgi:hypothetical protein
VAEARPHRADGDGVAGLVGRDDAARLTWVNACFAHCVLDWAPLFSKEPIMRFSSLGSAGRRTSIVAAALGFLLETTGLVLAQNYAGMSCSALWYARNAIYAENGYCFKTAKARAVFGKGCFPPFGHLSTWEQEQVSDIQYWESEKGCN